MPDYGYSFQPKHVAFILPEYNTVLKNRHIQLYLITQRGWWVLT
jgi:hypothetical protein